MILHLYIYICTRRSYVSRVANENEKVAKLNATDKEANNINNLIQLGDNQGDEFFVGQLPSCGVLLVKTERVERK